MRLAHCTRSVAGQSELPGEGPAEAVCSCLNLAKTYNSQGHWISPPARIATVSRRVFGRSVAQRGRRVEKLKGEVVSVRDAGDLVTDISVAALVAVPRDEQVCIRCDGHATSGIFPVDHDQPEMTFIAVEGESGFLELALVGDSANRFLGIKLGASVSLEW